MNIYTFVKCLSNRVSREEQLKLIMECRSSGLSDYQWCETQGIPPGTFYNWISKLRKAGVTLPDSGSKHMEIVMGNSTIRFFNNTNPELIRTTLQCLGEMSHAW